MSSSNLMGEVILSHNLKCLRKLHRFSQLQVAKRIGIDRNTYRGYEKGARYAPSWVIMKLAALYGVQVETLYSPENTPVTVQKEANQANESFNSGYPAKNR